MIIADHLRLHARTRPGKAAIIERGGSVDYAALDAMVDGVCAALATLGVGKGDLIGVALDDTARHVAVLLALGRMGAVLLPLDRRWVVAESQGVADRFGARLILTDREDAPAWVRVDDPWFARGAPAYLDASVTDDLPMVLSLSSGTTGLPKGPRLTHRQIIGRFMVYWIDVGLGPRDRFVVPTPLFFGGGRAFALAMIYVGGTACLLAPPYEPAELVAFASDVDATAMFLVPTLIRRLLAEEYDELAFPTVRALISSGSALYAAEARETREKLTPHLWQYYASTEAGGVTLLAPADHDAKAGSVGRPCFAVSVEVVDDAHAPVPAETVGQLRYRSPASPTDYHMGDGAAAFHDGWFYPGDLASFDADGFLHLRGRKKDMIIRGGVNIYPADIEQVLLDHAAVADAAVLGFPSPELGEEIAAFVVLRASVDESELRQACAARLARYKMPKLIIILPALPKNSAGKTLKAELSKLLPTLSETRA
jgi:acyl-CoA synthetase (AMP-forming)/AMP-acid ligase II